MFEQFPITFYALTLWSLIWKGLALWRAAAGKQRNWFIAILALNTVGILEIVFLFKFAKDRLTLTEIKSWISPQKTSKK
jgi:hypothetical protein